jgi:AcrR family transcriptional regulator
LDRGFHGAALEEISERAGYTTGAVYSSWKGKDELFLAVLDEHVDERIRSYVDVAMDAEDFEGAIRAVARSQTMRAEGEPRWTPLLMEFWTHAARRDELRGALRERQERQLDALTNLIEAIAARWGIEFRLPAREVVRGTGALGRGLGLELMLRPGADLGELFEELFLGATLAVTFPQDQGKEAK